MSDAELTDQQVLDFLHKNVNFLHQHPELITHLELEHNQQGAISLVERQVKALRDKNSNLQGQLIQLLKAAQDNEVLFAGCTELFERWLGEPNAEVIIDSLSDDIRELFAVDKVKIVLNDNSDASGGLLILASEDPEGFKATMGTLFLEQIGRVLSSVL